MDVKFRTVEKLHANPKNPRRIEAAKEKQLKKALEAFGDLGGIVFNRRTSQLVGGHQRVKSFPNSAQVHITKAYDEPTKNGTVGEGYVELKGERFAYREVDWDEGTEMAANLAANKGAGDFDMPMVAEMMADLHQFDINLDLTMFDAAERDGMVSPSDFMPSEEIPSRLDEKKLILCPSCGHEF